MSYFGPSFRIREPSLPANTDSTMLGSGVADAADVGLHCSVLHFQRTTKNYSTLQDTS